MKYFLVLRFFENVEIAKLFPYYFIGFFCTFHLEIVTFFRSEAIFGVSTRFTTRELFLVTHFQAVKFLLVREGREELLLKVYGKTLLTVS